MSAEFLALVAGSVLSLLFSYIPGLNTGFAALGSEVKRLIMVGLLLGVAAAVYGLSCAGFGSAIGVEIACNQEGLVAVVTAFVLAVVANQSAYAITPKTSAVRAIE